MHKLNQLGLLGSFQLVQIKEGRRVATPKETLEVLTPSSTTKEYKGNLHFERECFKYYCYVGIDHVVLTVE